MKPAVLLVWSWAVSPGVFAGLALLWCLDLGAGSILAYRRPDLFGSMDAYPFATWLRVEAPRAWPLSLWVHLLAALTWLMAASLLLCTANWFWRRRRKLSGLGEVLVHLGFLLVFAGFVAGSLLGARARGIRAPLGEETAVPALGVSLHPGGLEVVRSEEGAVLDTVSSLTLTAGGRASTGTARTNHPLMRGPLVVYPRGSTLLVSGARVTVEGSGAAELAAGAPVPLPGGRVLHLRGALQEGERRGTLPGPGVFVTLTGARGEPLRAGFLAPLPGRDGVVLEGSRVRLLGLTGTRAAVYDVHRDPGVPMVLAGAVLIALGSLWALAGYLREAAARGEGET